MKKAVPIIITVLLLMNGSVVRAEILPALELERNSSGYTIPGPVLRTHGWEFTVTEDLAIVGLGIFDLDDDGLYLSHEIGIWHSGEILFSTIIPAGVETLLIDQFRYVEIDPFWLTAGETYVIGNTTWGDFFVGNNSLATIETLPSITYERTLISPSDSGFSLPTLERDFYNFGPNFLVIPEPMTMVMLGLGGLLLIRKRST